MELRIFDPHRSQEISELRVVTYTKIAEAEGKLLEAFSVHALWLLALVVFLAVCQSECVHDFFVWLDSSN